MTRDLPKPAARPANQAPRERSGLWFVAPYFLIFAAFGLFGLGYSFYVSLNLWVLSGSDAMEFRGLSRYLLVLRDPDYWAAMGRSLAAGLPVVIAQHLIALPLAFALHLVFARALGSLGALFFLPYLAASLSLSASLTLFLTLLLTPVNDVLGWLRAFEPLGWLPSLPTYGTDAAAQLWSAVGWNVLLYLMAIGAIPRSLLEAAQLDGAGFWLQLRRIVFPVVRPMVFVAFGMSLVSGLQTNAWTASYANFDTVNLPGYIYGTAFRFFNLGLANTQTWVFFGVMLAIIALAYFWIGRNFTELQTSAGLEADHAPLRLPAVTTVVIKLLVVTGLIVSVLPILSLFSEATRGTGGPSVLLQPVDEAQPPPEAGLFWQYVPPYFRDLLGGSSGPFSLAWGAGALSNYQQLMEYLPLFWRNLWNSLYVSGLATLGTVVTSALAGFAFALLSFPYKRPLFLVVMATLVFPAMSNAIPYLIQMRLLDWIDTPRALWVPAMVSALGVFLVRQYTQSAIPKSLVESARVDGASDWLVFWRIALPQMTPVLTTVALLTFVTTWNHLDSAIFLMRSEETRLLPQALGLLSDGGGYALAMGAALGMVPVLLVFWLTASQLGRGLGIAARPARGLRQTLEGWRLGLLERLQQTFGPASSIGVVDGADGIRAMACLMVVFSHLGQRLNMPEQPQWIQELQAFSMTGAFGVSVFFVLSGMLLALPFWRRYLQGKPRPSLGEFASRRFLRIAPGFYVALIVTFLIARAFEPGDQMWLRLASALTFTSGFHWVTFFPVELNGPLWSIGFEVFCYALMPLFMVGLFALAGVFPRRPSHVSEQVTEQTETRSGPDGLTEVKTRTVVRTKIWSGDAVRAPGAEHPRSFPLAVAFWVAVLLLTMTAHQWILVNLEPDSSERGWNYGLIGGAKFWMMHYNVVGMFAHYCVGVLCAGWIAYRQYQLAQNPNMAGRHRAFDVLTVLGVVGAIGIMWAMRRAPEFSFSIGEQPYAFPAFSLLIALALGAAPFATFVHRWMDNPFARYTARVSFGLYIWHYPILELVRLFHNSEYKYFGISDLGYWFALTTFVLIAAYTVASLSYTHVEKPFLPRGHR
ncbi:MAG: acyltransferase family protein [Meiothermus sp.]|nr:acyltransferase family protein [Meiothermus sp.]